MEYIFGPIIAIGMIWFIWQILKVVFRFFEAMGEAGREDAERMLNGKPPKYGPPPF